MLSAHRRPGRVVPLSSGTVPDRRPAGCRKDQPLITMLHLRGELDLASVPDVVRLLADHRPGPGARLVVNLAGVSFADCAGLRPLLAAEEDARARGASMVLAGASRPVARALALLAAQAGEVRRPSAS